MIIKCHLAQHQKGLVKMTYPSDLQYLNDSLSKGLSSLMVYFRAVKGTKWCSFTRDRVACTCTETIDVHGLNINKTQLLMPKNISFLYVSHQRRHHIQST